MTAELLYKICTIGIVPAWLLLIIAPQWKYTQLIVHSLFIPLILGFLYLGLLLSTEINTAWDVNLFTLDGARQFFVSENGFLAGWVHYIVFDLFIGAWAVRDAMKNKINHWIVIACLVMILLVGPVGLLIYSIVRLVKTKSLMIEE